MNNKKEEVLLNFLFLFLYYNVIKANNIMNIIIRNRKPTPKIIKNVKNLSIGDEPGIFIEVDNYNELFYELDKDGFKPQLCGKIINCEVTSLTAFD